jgi:excisionase family DNA binding protein
MSPQFYDVKQVAELLHTTPAYIRKLCFQRKIPYCKPLGGKILFDASEIEAFVRKARVSTTKELEDRATALLNSRGTK